MLVGRLFVVDRNVLILLYILHRYSGVLPGGLRGEEGEKCGGVLILVNKGASQPISDFISYSQVLKLHFFK